MVTSLQKQISHGIRSARVDRRLSQAELAQKLGISQSRLSEIEQGKGSITAEQFIFLLQFFNLPISHFVKQENVSFEDQLQNRMIQLGGRSLREVSNVLPSEKINSIYTVVIETLVGGLTSRLVLGLIPVVISNIDQIDFYRLRSKFTEVGQKNRIYWFIDGLLNAIQVRCKQFVPHQYVRLYRRAEVQLSRARLFSQLDNADGVEDVLDMDITTPRTLGNVRASCDDLAKKWNIITRITQEDFNKALLEMEKT